MSVDRAQTMGLTAREIAEALADAAFDDTGSAPTRPYGAPVIGDLDIPAAWDDSKPAAWNASGEPREEQQ